MLQISQYLFSQASRATAAVFRERRQLAFVQLGFVKLSDGAFVEHLPFYGPYLLAGQQKKKKNKKEISLILLWTDFMLLRAAALAS